MLVVTTSSFDTWLFSHHVHRWAVFRVFTIMKREPIIRAKMCFISNHRRRRHCRQETSSRSHTKNKSEECVSSFFGTEEVYQLSHKFVIEATIVCAIYVNDATYVLNQKKNTLACKQNFSSSFLSHHTEVGARLLHCWSIIDKRDRRLKLTFDNSSSVDWET